MTEASDRVCVDCLAQYEVMLADGLVGIGDRRPKNRAAPYGGPKSARCATHWREKKKRDKDASHARRTKSVYSMEIDDYRKLKEYQNGKCGICQRATGATKRLAVDHDHDCCSGPTSCGQCIRGLLCGPCNSLLAHVRDDIATLTRAIWYLRIPPTRRLAEKWGEYK